jgi:glycosyltransferase involved in cell wall biosynthesis
VESSLQSVGKSESDFEVVVADDASWDGSVEGTVERFPQVRVVRHDKRRGTSPTKHLVAQSAQGDVLVFLDGHCHPQAGGLVRLVEDVEQLDGQAVVTPAVPALDAQRWENALWSLGHGLPTAVGRALSLCIPARSCRPPRATGTFHFDGCRKLGACFDSLDDRVNNSSCAAQCRGTAANLIDRRIRSFAAEVARKPRLKTIACRVK